MGARSCRAGDLSGAADILAQTVELAPGFATAWFALGELRDRLGERDAAIAAFRRRASPIRRITGARLHLARLGAERTAAMPPAYVRALFDQYAPRVRRRLTEGLDYRGPRVLRDAIAGRRGDRPAMTFRRCSIWAAARALGRGVSAIHQRPDDRASTCRRP